MLCEKCSVCRENVKIIEVIKSVVKRYYFYYQHEHAFTWPLLFISETLKHVANTVAHVHLTDHVVDVVFTLFDENSK